MLALTRKTHESIVICKPSSDEPLMEVFVVEIRGDRVRLSIDLPPQYRVLRKELMNQRPEAGKHPGERQVLKRDSVAPG